jgi:hypothetical protein
MLVDEDERRNQLTLRVQQVHLRGGRDHVPEDLSDA